MTPSHLHRYTGGLTIFVVLLAVLNLTRVPDAAAASIAACVTMFAIWGVVGLKTKFSSRAHLSEVEQTFFIAAVMFAGLLLLTSLAAKLLGHIYDIDADLLKRGRNVLIGLGLLFFANLMPKMIGPALGTSRTMAAASSVRRFAGWALVLGAIGYIGAYLFAPLSQASILAKLFVGTAVILVGLRVVVARLKARRTS